MAEVQLKVSSQELKKKAGEIEQQVADVQREWKNLCEIVRTSRYYWEGEAGDEGRRFLDEILLEMQRILGRMQKHPSSLLEMAGIYVDAEEKAEQLANALPDHVLL